METLYLREIERIEKKNKKGEIKYIEKEYFKPYHFEITMKTILYLEQKYGDGKTIFDQVITPLIINGLMNGNKDMVMTNCLKLLTCCCEERKDFTIEEFIDKLDPMDILGNNILQVTTNLIASFIGTSKKNQIATQKK